MFNNLLKHCTKIICMREQRYTRKLNIYGTIILPGHRRIHLPDTTIPYY